MAATALGGSPSVDRAPRARIRTRAATIAYALVLIAVALRLATLLVPHFFFADEIFQYLEPAHRLVFGDGIVAWEQRYHVRPWIFPLTLAGPMWLGAAIAPASTAYLLAPKLALLILSLLSLWSGAALGRLISPLHALFALFVMTIWFEAVYFSTQALTEAATIPFFLAGAALLHRGRGLVAAGALFGAAACVRFQYAPAIAAFVACAIAARPRDLIPVMIGGTIAVTGAALIELAMGASPIGWLFENIHQNIGLQRSHRWVSEPLFYVRAIADLWDVWLWPLLALALLGALRWPALAICALTNIVAHSLIAHKEYRYILLSTAVTILLAAFGTADVILWLRRRSRDIALMPLAIAAAAAWLLASASLAFGPEARLWWRQGTPMLQAFDALRRAPRLCGVALHGIDWSASGGYTYLHRAVPILVYRADQTPLLTRNDRAFDAIVAPATLGAPTGFARDRCFDDAPGAPPVCISRRVGACRPPVPADEVNASLVRLDQ